MRTEHLEYVGRYAWQNYQLMNNTGEKTGDVERSPGQALLLGTESWCKTRSWYPGSSSDKKSKIRSFVSYLSEKWVISALETIKDVAGSKGELILYFKSKFWAWVGKLRADSVHQIVIYSLRPLSKLRRARLKLFTLGGNLFKLSLATYSVRFPNESLEFVCDRTPRHKCKTPSSGTACFSPTSCPRTGLSVGNCRLWCVRSWMLWYELRESSRFVSRVPSQFNKQICPCVC